ncbi:MAG: DNA mismatch repair protein MutL [Candidatus Fervidibacterota bacterium]
MVGRIVILPPEVASQIAAGEVVERPASVVKELVENALDAGATRITIRVEEGGKKLICVTDDGCGMEADDAVLAFQRHATSKIRDADDLWRIVTMGFRGEALSSIAAVAQVELVTRPPHAEQGTRVVVEGGYLKTVEPIGCPQGTAVTVRNLFFNTPARLKFLKAAATEFAHLAEVVSRYILAFPEVAFTLFHGEREVLRHVPTGDERAALAEVVGRELAQQLVPVQYHEPPYTVRGFISPPTLTKPTRSHQWFFVNRRFVRNKTLAIAVSHAYHGFAPEGRQPVVVLFLDLPPEWVDVNVHPAKIEVRFRKEGEIQAIVVRALREALVAGRVVPVPSVRVSPGEVAQPLNLRPPTAEPSPKTLQKELTDLRTFLRMRFGRAEPTAPASPPPAPTPSSPPHLSVSPLSLLPRPISLTPIQQLAATYILAVNEEGDMFIISQHRAHERVLFEQLLRRAEGGEVVRQGLVVPFPLHLGQAQAAFVEANLSVLKGAGFELEPFGRNTYLVRTVPALLAQHDYEQILRDLIDELTAGESVSTGELFHDILATVACKAAVKAGDILSPEEMQRLLDDLLALENPSLCPHGQPILIVLPKAELDKRFERK